MAALILMVRSVAEQRVSNTTSRVYPTCDLKLPISGRPEIGQAPNLSAACLLRDGRGACHRAALRADPLAASSG